MKTDAELIASLRDGSRRVTWRDDRVRILAADRIEALRKALVALVDRVDVEAIVMMNERDRLYANGPTPKAVEVARAVLEGGAA